MRLICKPLVRLLLGAMQAKRPACGPDTSVTPKNVPVAWIRKITDQFEPRRSPMLQA